MPGKVLLQPLVVGVMGQALRACGKKKYHEKQTELIILMANSLNLVSKFTEFTDQFH
jgi:hypothetical protein